MSTTNVNVNELLCALPYGTQLNITFTGEKYVISDDNEYGDDSELQPMMDDVLENGITGSIISREEYEGSDGFTAVKFQVKEKYRLYTIFIIFDPITKRYSEYIEIQVSRIYRALNPNDSFEHDEHVFTVSLPVSDYYIKFKVEF
jgi:hypothetical protein